MSIMEEAMQSQMEGSLHNQEQLYKEIEDLGFMDYNYDFLRLDKVVIHKQSFQITLMKKVFGTDIDREIGKLKNIQQIIKLL